jgi:hypothetical protein
MAQGADKPLMNLSVSGANKKQNFEKTFRWREDANETMAMAMLNQVLYPVPDPLKNLVARVFVSIVDWDSKYNSVVLPHE